MDVSCDDCHDPADLPENPEHKQHAENIDCSACHSEGVVTCYNCHFESEIKFDKKVPYAPFHGWIFLMNFRGKVRAANLMALEYKDKTFITLAPYYAHTINPKGRTCEDCHQNPAVQEYTQKGTIAAVQRETGQPPGCYPDSSRLHESAQVRLRHLRFRLPKPQDGPLEVLRDRPGHLPDALRLSPDGGADEEARREAAD